MINYKNLQKLLFLLDAETSHDLAHSALRGLQRAPWLLETVANRFAVRDARLSQKIWDNVFPNPVGLAAGFDKNASIIKAMTALGFGFVEVGSVTPKPQVGNSKPRLFRYPEQQSIQNAMGFNNQGMETALCNIIKARPSNIPIGVNLGKNKATSQEMALNDYEQLVKVFRDVGDYLVFNLSSPNTPGLRDLQNSVFIRELFAMAKALTSKPLLLKISPDMDNSDAVDLCNLAVECGAAGIIATNTSIDYSLLSGAQTTGGLSGRVLTEKSFRLFATLGLELFGRCVLISVGGIDSGAEAYRRLRAGATFVQVYSGLIFQGPSLVRRINEELLALLTRDGFSHVSAAIGVDV